MIVSVDEVLEEFAEAAHKGRRREWLAHDQFSIVGPSPGRVRAPRSPADRRRHRKPEPRCARYAYTFREVCGVCGLEVEHRIGLPVGKGVHLGGKRGGACVGPR